jgi:hypothetical protein
LISTIYGRVIGYPKEFKPGALDASVIGLILCYDGKIVGSYP